MRYAVIDKTGTVVNIIEYDGKSQYDPGPGLSLRKATLNDSISQLPEVETVQSEGLPSTTADALREALSDAKTVEDVKTAILDVLAPEESQRSEK